MRDLNQTMSMTLSGELEDTSSFSYLGLPGLSLALPSASPYSPFAGDVLLHRYIDAPGALGRQTDTLSGQLGFLVDGYLGDWRWTVNGGYDRTETKTRTGRGLNDDALQAGVTAGTIDPFGDLGQLPANPFDTARSISSKSSLEGVINGTAWEGPAGSLTSTFKVGFDSQSLDSETLRFSEEQQASVFSERSLSRDRTSASGNFNLPIASRDREVLGALGDLSANLNLAYEDLSDFGGLSAYTVGLNWSPWEPVNFTASWADEQKAPSMSQLNDPTISTPNVPVYDFATGQSVNIVRIEGGNPNLSEETKRVLKFGVNLTPLKDKDLRFTANYTRTETEGSIASFPTITPELEAALPERFTRDLDGNLVSIDARPLNFQKAEQQEIRWGLNFSTAFGKPDPAAMARMNTRSGGGQRGEHGGGGQTRLEGLRHMALLSSSCRWSENASPKLKAPPALSLCAVHLSCRTQSRLTLRPRPSSCEKTDIVHFLPHTGDGQRPHCRALWHPWAHLEKQTWLWMCCGAAFTASRCRSPALLSSPCRSLWNVSENHGPQHPPTPSPINLAAVPV